MTRDAIGRASIPVTYLDPSKLSELNSNDLIVVNRVSLNSKNVELVIKCPSKDHNEQIIVIQHAIKSMKQRERELKRSVFGAEMRVGEALKIFDNLASLPKNTFALAAK